MPKKVPVTIGDRSFESITEAEDFYREIRDRYRDKEQVSDPEDVEAIDDLFHSHSEFEEKVSGRTISHYVVDTILVGPPYYKSRCFFAVFTDGSRVDFSFPHAIREAARRAQEKA